MKNKLVRDKIPEIMKKKGQKTSTYEADDSEYWERLQDKLREEVDEFLEAGSEEELADVMEVIKAISEHRDIDLDKIEKIRKKKANERGGFKKRVVWNRENV